jgi:hypothetical protein
VLATKARVCKVVGQEGSPWVTSSAPWNAKECEEMNPHTSKWTCILGVEISMDFQIFRMRLYGSKPIGLKSYLYHWNFIEILMSKMGSHDPFGHLKHKLWPKERLGVKLIVWPLTTKSWESTIFPCVQVTCNIPLESSWQRLQLFFKIHDNQRYAHKIMGPKSRKSPNSRNFGTPIWESWDKMPFGWGPHGEVQSIL